MEKLQTILKWLSEADEYQIDGLYEVLENDRLHYIEDVKGKELYNEFINDIKGDNE